MGHAWGNRIDQHACIATFQSKSPRERGVGTFGCAVVRHFRRTLVGKLRRDVDDSTLATTLHVPVGRLCHEECAFHMHIQHPVEAFLADIFERLGDVVAGVVDQDVDVTNRTYRVCIEFFDCSW